MGIAVCDPSERVASPVCVLPAREVTDIRKVADAISKNCGIPHEFADERLSSREAKRSLREKGLSEKDMRGKVDMIAASLFLQAWLDERAARNLER